MAIGTIEELNPGRNLDALIAINVRGWRYITDENSAYKRLVPPEGDERNGLLSATEWDWKNRPDWLPRYSTDIRTALKIAEAWEYNWNLFRDVGKSGSYETKGDGYGVILSYPGFQMWPVRGETLQHAICLAALKLYELDIPSNE